MFTPLLIVLAALGLMVGFYTRQQAMRRIGQLLAIAAVTPLAISIARNYFGQLSTIQQVVAVLCVVTVVILIATYFVLGPKWTIEVAIKLIGRLLWTIVSVPFKLLAVVVRKYR